MKSSIASKGKFNLSSSDLAESSWDGTVIATSGEFAVASIFKSLEHPGFFHCRVIGMTLVSETKRPVPFDLVGPQLESLLSDHGLGADGLSWKKTEVKACDPCTKNYPKQPTGEIVYFLRAGPFIKIGKATNTPDDRVNTLQTGCPYTIEVMKFIPGGTDLEKKLHKKFAHCRARGEWFNPSAPLLRFIESLEN